MRLSDYAKRVPPEIRYLFLVFVSSRIILTIVGVGARRLLDSFCIYRQGWVLSGHVWLDIWGIHDSGWYAKIANDWYPALSGQVTSEYGFFPLYPLLMRLSAFFTHDVFLGGIIVSNICLVISGIVLYRLVLLRSDRETASRSLKYLFVFPSAFILSAVFSESLFLMLLLLSFYFARREKWLVAGMSGFLLSLAKPIGILVILPLFYEYLARKGFKWKDVRRDALYLMLLPAGLFVFAAYSHYMTGRFDAYLLAQRNGWGIELSNPVYVLWDGFSRDPYPAIFVTGLIIALCVFAKRIGFSYWMLGMLLIAVPLMSGESSLTSAGRYAVAAFPLYIAFAEAGRARHLDGALTIFFAIAQGCLMAFWCSGFNLIV